LVEAQANPPNDHDSNDQFVDAEDAEDTSNDDDDDAANNQDHCSDQLNAKTLHALKELSTFYNLAATTYV